MKQQPITKAQLIKELEDLHARYAELENQTAGQQQKIAALQKQVELRDYNTQLELNELTLAKRNQELEEQKSALKNANRAYKVLLESSQAVKRATGEKGLLNRICRVLVNQGGIKLAWIGFVDPNGEAGLRPVAQAGAGGEIPHLDVLAQREASLNHNHPYVAMHTGRPSICEDIQGSEEYAFWHDTAAAHELASFIALPLCEDGHCLGVLHVYAGKCDAFNVQEVHLLMELAFDLTFGLKGLRVHTEREQSEEALRQSEVYFRSMIENAQDIVTIINGDGTIRYESPAVERVLGYQISELIGRPVFDFIHPDDLAAVSNIFRARIGMTGPAPIFVTRFRHKDGTWRYLEASGNNLLEDPLVAGVIINSRDITERKQAEEAATQLGKVLDDSLNEIYTFDAQSLRFVQVNQGARENLGYSAEEIERLTPIDIKPEFTTDQFNQLVEPLRQGKKGKIQFTTMHKRKDGTLYPVEVNLQLSNVGDSQLFIAIIVDITERIEIEEQIRRQERLAAVGQLAAGIAHDFNNIMAIISLYAQLLSSSPNLSGKEKKQLETILQQAIHAAELTGQILDFSRQSIITRRPLDLYPLLQDVTQLLTRTLPEDIHIELTGAVDEYPVDADANRLRQAFMNLALNARDAMPAGGRLHFNLELINISAGERPFALDLQPGNWVKIGVTDTGSGIPYESLAHLFEPFYTTKPPGQGTGLGLAQVYGIVKQHDGYVDVESETGYGTTFMLFLPVLSKGTTQPLLPDESTTLIQGEGQTILLVEDNRATLEALVEALKKLNYHILTAANGLEALEVLEQKKNKIALVLSDMVMPEMGGRALLKAMQAREIATPVVILTGHPLADDFDDLRPVGLKEWVSKPVTIEKLAHVVARLLREV